MSLIFLETLNKESIIDVDLLNEEASGPDEKTSRIYFILVNTESIVAKMISKVTRAPYTHVAISFDEKLKDIFSFNVDANGMKKEILETTYEGKNRMSVYFMDLPESVVTQIKERVTKMYENGKHYSYSMLSIVKFLIPRKVSEYMGIDEEDDSEKRQSFICSQFASWLLLAHDIKLFSRKNNMLLSPYDFMKSKLTKLYFRGTVEGFIKRFRNGN